VAAKEGENGGRSEGKTERKNWWLNEWVVGKVCSSYELVIGKVCQKNE